MVNTLFTHQGPETGIWQGLDQHAFGTPESRSISGQELVRRTDGTYALRQQTQEAARSILACPEK